MRRTIISATAAILIIGGGVTSPRPAAAQAAGPVHDHSATATTSTTTTQTTKVASSAPSGLRALADYQIGDAQKKLVALAEATPADKFGWRPGEGVRSVGEVFMHVASANYFFPTFWDAKLPAGVDPRTLEKDGGDKAKTVAALKQSFDFLRQSIAGPLGRARPRAFRPRPLLVRVSSFVSPLIFPPPSVPIVCSQAGCVECILFMHSINYPDGRADTGEGSRCGSPEILPLRARSTGYTKRHTRAN